MSIYLIIPGWDWFSEKILANVKENVEKRLPGCSTSKASRYF
jgi:hypothetical protein